MCLNLVLQAIFYKLAGGGKLKFYFGLTVEIYGENAMKRNAYLWARLLADVIPVFIIAMLAIFLWTYYIYLSLAVILCNALMYLPVYLFVLKHEKLCLVQFEKDTLNVYVKN